MAHLDELGDDLASVLGAGGGRADVLLLQEEVDQPGDEGHAGGQVLVTRAEGALIVPRHRHVQRLGAVVGQVFR